jgi:hypothetical protein
MPEAAVRAALGELVAQSHEVDPATGMAARPGVSPSAMGWQLPSPALVEETV